MRKAVALAVVLAALAGCKDERPARWTRECVESHTEMRLQYAPHMPGFGVNLGGGMRLAPATVCDRHDYVCRPAGKDYTGPQTTCGPKPTEN